MGLADRNYSIKTDKRQGPTLQHRNYSQYPAINHNGKEYEKEYVTEKKLFFIFSYKYVSEYEKLNHFAVHEKLTQHCTLIILQFKNT